MAKLLIVNADDFGLTPGVNRGIIEGYTRGIVTSASMLVNMDGFRDAAALARRHRGLAVGLHLNLTYGRPLSAPAPAAGLTGAKGFFHDDPDRVLANPSPEAVRTEFRAQARRFLHAGLRPSHLDTHHHLHRAGWILDLLAELANQLAVPIRCLDASMLKARGLSPLARHLSFHGGGHGVERLVAMIASLPEGAAEISCHPGYCDNELEALSRLNKRRERELAALIDPRIATAVRERGIVLTNYRRLSRSDAALWFQPAGRGTGRKSR